MFSKFALLSKEFSFFGVLTLLSGMTLADFQWLLNMLPETISIATAATLGFVFSVCGLILRYFFTDGKLTFFKKNVTSEREKSALKEIAEAVKDNPADIIDLQKAARVIKEKKELADLEAQFARMEELKKKLETAA